jgi:hypothetical protein
MRFKNQACLLINRTTAASSTAVTVGSYIVVVILCYIHISYCIAWGSYIMTNFS